MIQIGLIRPCQTATEPPEYSITHFMGVNSEFHVNEFISIIKILDSMWSSMFQSSLSCVHSPKKTGVYVAKIDISGMKRGFKLQIRPVHIETDASKIELLKMGYENCCVTSIIWK